MMLGYWGGWQLDEEEEEEEEEEEGEKVEEEEAGGGAGGGAPSPATPPISSGDCHRSSMWLLWANGEAASFLATSS